MAPFIFVVLLFAVLVGGQYSGFWASISPFILDTAAPLGLKREFAVNLVAGTAPSAAQIAFTYLIVSFELGRENRNRKVRDRAEFGRQFCEMYMRLILRYLSWPARLPSKLQREYREKNFEIESLMRRYGSELDDVRDTIREINALFDKLAYGFKLEELERLKREMCVLLRILVRETMWNKIVRRVTSQRVAPWEKISEEFAGRAAKLAKKIADTPPATRAALLAELPEEPLDEPYGAFEFV